MTSVCHLFVDWVLSLLRAAGLGSVVLAAVTSAHAATDGALDSVSSTATLSITIQVYQRPVVPSVIVPEGFFAEAETGASDANVGEAETVASADSIEEAETVASADSKGESDSGESKKGESKKGESKKGESKKGESKKAASLADAANRVDSDVEVFYIDDPKMQSWFANKIKKEGEATLSLCMPKNSGGQFVAVGDSAGGTSDFVQAGSSPGSYTITVTAGASKCPGGAIATKVQVTMITTDPNSPSGSEPKQLISEEPKGEFVKVALIVVPR